MPRADGEVVIKVEDLWKLFKLYEKPIDRLKELFHPFRKKYHREFWALKGISFEVKRGESLGIIGRNGSGKTTLLRILAGIMIPTKGSITAKGRISPLIELGIGFNPELSGLENIYFSGTILGYTREEIEEKLDKILSFADIGDFIRVPVKYYSKGMRARLAFSLAINLEPDILLVDEVLAVGDENFRRKCLKRIEELISNGTILILVSHSLQQIEEFCSKTLWLHRGDVMELGETKEVLKKYKSFRES